MMIPAELRLLSLGTPSIISSAPQVSVRPRRDGSIVMETLHWRPGPVSVDICVGSSWSPYSQWMWKASGGYASRRTQRNVEFSPSRREPERSMRGTPGNAGYRRRERERSERIGMEDEKRRGREEGKRRKGGKRKREKEVKWMKGKRGGEERQRTRGEKTRVNVITTLCHFSGCPMKGLYEI